MRAVAIGAVFSLIPIAAAAQGEQDQDTASQAEEQAAKEQTPPAQAPQSEENTELEEAATAPEPEEAAMVPEPEEAATVPTQSETVEAQLSVQKEAPVIMSHKKRAVWTLVGVSGAALISGGIFGLTALDEKQRYEDNPADDFKERKDARAIASYVSFGVAGAAAAAALIVWLVVDDKCDPNDDRASVTTDGTTLTVKF